MRATGVDLRSVVDRLGRARTHRHAVPRITDDAELSDRDAYAVQDAWLLDELVGGARCVGVKLGLTSEAKQRRMNVDVPIVGWLTDAMLLPDGSRLGDAIHPRVEPEIAFVLGDDLSGPDVTATRARTAVAEVRAALEVIDSRFDGFRFAFADVVADNASGFGYLLGRNHVPPRDVDARAEEVTLLVDGRAVASAFGEAVLGEPYEALALAANLLAERGHRLRTGWVVLTGGMTDAVPIGPGHVVSARFATLGDISLEWARP